MTNLATVLPARKASAPSEIDHVAFVVASGPGQELGASEEQRKMLCLVENPKLGSQEPTHILYLSESHSSHHLAQSYMGRLEYMEIEYRVEKVRIEFIEHLYSNSNSQAGELATSDMQRKAMQFMQRAAELESSDVHMMLEESALQVKFRIHGELEPAGQLHHEEGKALQSAIYSSMCEAADEFFKPEVAQDARMKRVFVDKCGLFGARIATRPMMTGPLMVMRLLYDHGQKRRLEELGYLQEQLTLLRRLVHQKKGIVVVSGVTGSGKSVTLQVLLQEVLEHFGYRIHLLTVEDPPEYVIAGANQTELGQETWPEAIKNAVRLDPDVLMVGEMRDFESAQAGVRGALTGHGLWTTLHTIDAISSIQRLLDLGVDPTLVLDPTLFKGFVNQSLTRVLCNQCKVPYHKERHRLSPDLQDRIEKFCTPDTVYLRGTGCDACSGKGVTGRTVVAEVLLPNLEFMRVFRNVSKAEAKVYWVREMGGITKIQHAIRLINSGVADPFLIEGDVGSLDEDFMSLGTSEMGASS